MPRLTENEEVIKVDGASSFQYSGVRIDKLSGASEYTLATLAIDRSGSVIKFEGQLLNMIKAVLLACKRNDRAENLLIRIITFNEKLIEIHGFRLLSDIDIDNDYNTLHCGGMTALVDATIDGAAATIDYAETLVRDFEFDVNGIMFVATDGCDNASMAKAPTIKTIVNKAVQDEKIESFSIILIKMREPGTAAHHGVDQSLDTFQKDAGITQFVDIGDATESTLARTANFISKSISSQSQALGTGGPSQALTF